MLSTVTIVIIAIVLLLIFFSFFTVEQQSHAIIERFGKFVRIASPGLNIKIPLIEQISGRLNMRIQQLDVHIETKTQDNVFVKLDVCVQFRVLEKNLYEAYYKLESPEEQITAFIFDVVRACVPKMALDDVFEKKDDIAQEILHELENTMLGFGYNIVKTLVTDIEPDQKVKASMNEINAAKRERMAATERGEADKILVVKKAEANAESDRLHGEGFAAQRKAIVQGLKESVTDFKDSIDDASAMEVMNLVLLTQYFDTIKDLGNTSNTNTILLPHSPGALGGLMDQLRDTLITSSQVKTTDATK